MASHTLTVHACRDNPEPKAESQPTLAYDRGQMLVLGDHLHNEDDRVVEAALVSLKRLLALHTAGPKVHEALLLPLLAEKVAAATGSESPSPIPHLALQCIEMTLQSPAHRMEALACVGVVPAIRAAFSFPQFGCRLHAYGSVSAASENRDCAVSVLASGLIRDVIKRLAVEVAALPGSCRLVEELLLSLRRLTSHSGTSAVDEALAHGAVPALYACLCLVATPSLDADALIASAAGVLTNIAMQPAGKRACIEMEGGVPLLVDIMKRGDPRTVAPVAGCLMVHTSCLPAVQLKRAHLCACAARDAVLLCERVRCAAQLAGYTCAGGVASDLLLMPRSSGMKCVACCSFCCKISLRTRGANLPPYCVCVSASLDVGSISHVSQLPLCVQGIAIDDEGKHQLMACNGPACLIQCFNHRDTLPPVALLNVCHALANVCALPAARESVLAMPDALAQLRLYLVAVPHPAVQRAGTAALKVIDWKA